MATESFLQTTPINLFFTLVLLFVNLKNPDRRMAWAAILAFSLGMLVEILGVNYGSIFGSYSYGENLRKNFSVPILIGANWVMLSFITGAIGEVRKTIKSLLPSGAVLWFLSIW